MHDDMLGKDPAPINHIPRYISSHRELVEEYLKAHVILINSAF